MEIEHLPDSLLLQVFKHLMFGDLCICARVCQRWRCVAGDHTLRRAINASSTPLSSRKALSLVRACGGCNLVELRISGRANKYFPDQKAHMFTPTFFRHLANSCPSLEVLHITHASLISYLPRTLVKLSLRSCLFHLVEFCGSTRLQVCDLGLSSPVSIVELCHLDRLPHLRALSLEGCQRVYDRCIFNIPRLMAQLVVLDIEGTGISDRGLSLVICLGVNLRYLFAGHTRVTGEAFTETLPCIRSRLESSEGLTHVCLRRTLVAQEHLPNLLAAAPRLEWLAVTGRHMSAQVNEWLVRSVPKTCKFVQCCIFHTSEEVFCHHFASATVKNIKWGAPPPIPASCDE
ncbi:F-box/LRR-repeat protein 12-like [Haemaphysalis longicornis]